MKKVIIILLMTILPVSVYAIGAGASVGAFFPSGESLKNYSPGIGANVFLELPVVPPIIDIRLAASIAQAKYKKYGWENTYNKQGLQAIAVAHAPIPAVNLYAGLGYGIYHNSIIYKPPYGYDKIDDYNKWGDGAVFIAGIGKSFSILYAGIHGEYILNRKRSANFDGFSLGLGLGLSL